MTPERFLESAASSPSAALSAAARSEAELDALAMQRAVARGDIWRRLLDVLARTACVLAVVLALLPLLGVLSYVLIRGWPALSLDFLSGLPAPVGETGGGIGNAIEGTLILVGLGASISVPLGILVGVYLAEYGQTRFAHLVRFAADSLSGAPSIVVGIFAYTVLVLPVKQFSTLAGGFALAVLMLPTVTRATEEMLALVPESLREAALALGVPRWRATLKVMVRTAAPGITTGVMLAVARAAGETAPLLFTAFGSRYWFEGVGQPVSSLPHQIFLYAVSPYEDWRTQAWGAALVLVTIVLCLNLLARFLVRPRR